MNTDTETSIEEKPSVKVEVLKTIQASTVDITPPVQTPVPVVSDKPKKKH